MSDTTDNSEPSADELEIQRAMYDGRTRWKYKQVSIWNSEFVKDLNSYGMFGWEVITVTPMQQKNEFTGKVESLGYSVVLFKMPYWIEQPDE